MAAALILGLLAALLLWWVWRSPSPALKPVQVPAALPPLLEQRLPWRCLLNAELRARHERQTQRLIDQLQFIGCNGLQVTHEQVVLVCGIAALLCLSAEQPPFPQLRSVLLYPAAFGVRDPEPDELGLVWDEPVETLGESWSEQRVVLSWADVEAALAGDPVNVVVHEFAHQLDDAAPQAEGAPPLPDYTEWSRVMQTEFAALQAGKGAVIDPYGAQSPGEFFAVVVEAYFQSGAALAEQHPALYQLMAGYFGFETNGLVDATDR